MKRTLSAAALALGVAAAVLAPATSSSAVTGAKVVVPLGSHFTVKKGAITGNSTVFQANYQRASRSATVAQCMQEPIGCEVVPVELAIPESDPDAIEAKGYVLTVVLDWDPGQRVDNVFQVGTVYENDLEGFLYQDPLALDSSGAAAYTARSNTTQPASLVAVSPTSKKFNIVVASFNGINKGYTLEFSLSSAKDLAFDPNEFKQGSTPPDYVKPTYTAPDSTPKDNGFGGASGPGFLPPTDPGQSGPIAVVASGPKPFVVPNIAGGSADGTLLALSNVDVRSGLGQRAVKVSSTIQTAAVGDSSVLAIVLALAALPLLAAGGLLQLFRRKKRTPVAVAS